MAQITSGIRSILSSPRVYDAFQAIMGADRARNRIVQDFIRAKPGDRILDLGCGTADYLAFLPDVHYVGWDLSADYIAAAQARFGNRGHFEQRDFVNLETNVDGEFDIALIGGVLHHLDDTTACKLLGVAHTLLRPGGRVVCIEPCFEVGQNPLAKLLVSLDRGQNVRTRPAYEQLAQPTFQTIHSTVCHQHWIPYTHCVMECTR